MNILYLATTEKIGGAEKILLNISEGLPKDTYHHFLITQEEGSLTENFLKLGGKVFIFKLPAWRKVKNIFKRYITIRYIADITRREQIDLIYANAYRLNPYVLGVWRACKIKAITHIHDVIEQEHIAHFLLHKSQYLVVPSNYIRICLGDIKARVFVVPNGIDVDRFSNIQKGKIRREFGISSNTFLIGMVANFVKKKGHKLFIEAASLIKKQIKNVKFIIVGDNIWKTSLTKEILQNFAKEKGVFEDTIFTGERNDIPQILNDLDIFVLPSERESFGMVILEAMASKVPVIAHKFSGGPSEIIEDGKDGLLVDCKSPNELVGAIFNLTNNNPLRNKLIEEGYKKVKEQFDISIFADNIRKVYQRVFGS